jgi:hypothetical protein
MVPILFIFHIPKFWDVTHGFPQRKMDHKIQELHARKNQMENLKLVVATGQVCIFRQ